MTGALCSPDTPGRRLRITAPVPNVHSYRHLGFAVDLVQADVLARHLRRHGVAVQVVSGTDENSMVTVRAARRAGLPPQDLVDRDAAGITELFDALRTNVDSCVRTSADPGHRAVVERLWRACTASGDLYRAEYRGLYCDRCDQFVTPAPGAGPVCPRDGGEVREEREENWFFRSSRYTDRIREEVRSGRLRIVPPSRRDEVLGLLDAGVNDMSVSRPRARSDGWGIPVPGDPDQVLYTWWDVLAAYLAGPEEGGRREAERWHVLGKGILRIHAVHWPALLLSAGLPLPSVLLVHQHLTTAGMPPQAGARGDHGPVRLAREYGDDSLRWWILREMTDGADSDFTVDRMVRRANDELANRIGNFVNRVVSMVHRYRGGVPPSPAGPAPKASSPPAALVAATGEAVDKALAAFDFRAATDAVLVLAEEGNRYVETVRPWDLAKAERRGDARAGQELDDALAVLLSAARELGTVLAPFTPSFAERILRQCSGSPLPSAVPLFPRREVTAS